MSKARAWVLAARPQTLAVGLAPVSAATGLATANGYFDGSTVTACFLCVVFLQVATNLANDYFDFMKGADTGERVGPTRATQAGHLSPKEVFLGMSVCLMLAAAAGGYLAGVGGLPIWIMGAVCLVCAVAYTGGPWPLAYHGLGDLFVFVFFGPVATVGTYYVQTLRYSDDAIQAGIGMGAFATAVLIVNNLRDRPTDEAAGKRTLVVRFGDKFAVWQYMMCLAIALGTPVVGMIRLGWSPWLLVCVVGVLSSVSPALVVAKFARGDAGDAQSTPDRRQLNAVLGMTARSVLMYGMLLATGFMSAVLWG